MPEKLCYLRVSRKTMGFTWFFRHELAPWHDPTIAPSESSLFYISVYPIEKLELLFPLEGRLSCPFPHSRYLILWEFFLLKYLNFKYLNICWKLDGESSAGGSKQYVFAYVSVSQGYPCASRFVVWTQNEVIWKWTILDRKVCQCQHEY